MSGCKDISGRVRLRKACGNKIPEIVKECCQKREDRQKEKPALISTGWYF